MATRIEIETETGSRELRESLNGTICYESTVETQSDKFDNMRYAY